MFFFMCILISQLGKLSIDDVDISVTQEYFIHRLSRRCGFGLLDILNGLGSKTCFYLQESVTCHTNVVMQAHMALLIN